MVAAQIRAAAQGGETALAGDVFQKIICIPKRSMYGIFTYMYSLNYSNVGK